MGKNGLTWLACVKGEFDWGKEKWISHQRKPSKFSFDRGCSSKWEKKLYDFSKTLFSSAIDWRETLTTVIPCVVLTYYGHLMLGLTERREFFSFFYMCFILYGSSFLLELIWSVVHTNVSTPTSNTAACNR